MVVLLLGAGASKAYADSPTGVRMPIAVDFFDTFEKLPIYENPWVLREGVFDFLSRVKGVDPVAYLRHGINIEELHSEVEEHLLQTMENGDQLERVLLFRPYNELTYIFSAVVNEIQNGPLSTVHQTLAERLQPEDVIVTFNWDTLMDRALASTGEWTTDYGYGFWPKSIYRDQWVTPAPVQGQSRSVRLLKLHGSSNWLTSHPMFHENGVTLMQDASPDSVWIYEYAVQPYDCYEGRFMAGYQPFSYGYYPPNILDVQGKPAPTGHVIVGVQPKFPWKPEGTTGDKGLVSIPLIIPPVRHKRYDLYGPLYEDLWAAAREALERADHIIIIGYSFPKTDIKSNQLFVSAFMNRRSVPLVSVVNPDPERIVTKLHMEFGVSNNYMRVYKSYFSEEFDLDVLFAL